MACLFPLTAYRTLEAGASSGKLQITFDIGRGVASTAFSVPCGQCVGCRLDRARQWAVRCLHEAKMHESNCFLTLTYNDDNYPKGGSLQPVDITNFFKRLRKRHGKMRYFQCGEYGEELQRPHHHVLLFGFDFPDKVLFELRESGDLYRSASLEALWSFGFSTIGALTFDTAMYTAGYILKKRLGLDSDAYYKGRHPEYVTMSRRPGIGYDFYSTYTADLYSYDSCVVNDSFIVKPPKYYDSKYDIDYPDSMIAIKSARQMHIPKPRDIDRKRLREIAACKTEYQKKKKRTYEIPSQALDFIPKRK